MKNAREFSPAQLAYVEAKAKQETVSSIVNECKTKVLSEHIFIAEDDNARDITRITKPSQDFLMSDEDFTTYCKLTHAEYLKQGLKVEDFDACPEWPFNKARMDAEKALIDWGYTVVRTLPEYKQNAKDIQRLMEVAERSPELRDRMINLTMRLDAI